MRRPEKFRAGERVNITRFPNDWNFAHAHIVTSHDPANHTFRRQLATAGQGRMLLVRLDGKGLSIDCEAVGAEARGLALDACRSTMASVGDPEDKFNSSKPLWRLLQGHISRLVGRHAVAHIIATNGL
jgi:hypothetical protein